MFIEKSDMTGSRIFRKGFGLKDQIRGEVDADYGNRVVAWFRENGYTVTSGRVTVSLARAFGFCYGVERAVDYAYETVKMYPERRIYLVGEIIHNAGVNARLTDLGITILPGLDLKDRAYDALEAEDVVIIPAFGTTMELFTDLRERGCVLVDTTCGSVMNVWKRVRQYANKGYTSIVHGKAAHEETRATCSVASDLGGHYLVVLDSDEACLVADTIRGRGLDRAAFLDRFRGCTSEGFDPDVHLGRLGCANQTTMLSSESLEVAAILEEAMRDRFGEESSDAFLSFDTICGATQERQDAVLEMLDTSSPPDAMVIIGGYNSSNTMHLVEIASQLVPTYFIRSADQLTSGEEIRHRDIQTGEERVTRGWLPEPRSGRGIHIGVTAGASSPDNQVGETICRILEITGAEQPPFAPATPSDAS